MNHEKTTIKNGEPPLIDEVLDIIYSSAGRRAFTSQFEDAMSVDRMYRQLGNNIRQHEVTRKAITQSEEAMSIDRMYRQLVEKIEEQGQMTRKTIEEESKQLRADILRSVKANPIATVDLISKLLLVSSLFALTVHVVSGFTIINPWFSMLMFAISVAGIGMAKIRRGTLD